MSAMVETLETSLDDSIIIAVAGLVEVEIGCGEAGNWQVTDHLSICWPISLTPLSLLHKR